MYFRGLILGLLLSILTSVEVMAQGVIFPSAGAMHRSMAGASTGFALDAVGATYWNPAVISSMTASEIFVGVDFVYANTFLDSAVAATGQFGSSRSDSGLAAAPAIGVVSRPRNSTWTYGLGIFSLIGRVTDYPGSEFNPILQPFDPPNSFGFGPISSSLNGLEIAPMFSKQINENLAVGGGIMVNSVTLTVDPALFTVRNANGLFPPATQTRPYWGFGFQAGIYYRPDNDLWSAGASFKSRRWFETFEYNSKDEIGRPIDLTTELNLPMTLSFGLGYFGMNKTKLAVDVRYLDYGNTELFGTEPAIGGLGWTSIWSLAIGGQRTINDMLRFQFGFGWNGDPIPDSDTIFNIQLPAINKYTISGGLSVSLTTSVDLVGSIVYGLPHTNRGTILEIPGTVIEMEQDLTTFSLGFKFTI